MSNKKYGTVVNYERKSYEGSVVTKDIPDWCIAAGNPCRVIRKITEEDRRKLFRDEEAWQYIMERMEF